MLGFTAKLSPKSKASDIKPDGIEIAKLRWFTREELKTEAHTILLPNRISIARALIEHWLGESVESASELSN
jgi:NAD+ diphosphatase